ncbi:hypothetical protein PIIN_03550 [Serendipita indica DSM 11827]|uniref:Uncharacterized protein n=1 Tax=Serendipita indica (strain DSM 11827) TaxID=1109443 RepID=G4TE67_SERID|nr:hypothetical protein PIIN_03550 [Serendipita indica DSM 11827]
MQFLFVLLAAVLSVSGRHATPPTFQLVVSLTSFDARNISSWSGGGGKPQQIPSGQSHPFEGRYFGGGVRANIAGTRAFGSGYPQNDLNKSTVSGRPFPYGVWPLYWGGNFMDSAEYGEDKDPIRPGGQLVVQSVRGTKERWGQDETETYYMLTDRETSFAMMTSFVTWCGAVPESWPVLFNATGAPLGEGRAGEMTFAVENVLRYYRASSFAMLHRGYNNSRARTADSSISLEQSDPLPEAVTRSRFYSCIEGVIENALPIVDGPAKGTSLGVILGIIFGIFGIPIIAFLWWFFACIFACIANCFR